MSASASGCVSSLTRRPLTSSEHWAMTFAALSPNSVSRLVRNSPTVETGRSRVLAPTTSAAAAKNRIVAIVNVHQVQTAGSMARCCTSVQSLASFSARACALGASPASIRVCSHNPSA